MPKEERRYICRVPPFRGKQLTDVSGDTVADWLNELYTVGGLELVSADSRMPFWIFVWKDDKST